MDTQAALRTATYAALRARLDTLREARAAGDPSVLSELDDVETDAGDGFDRVVSDEIRRVEGTLRRLGARHDQIR